MKLAGFKHSYCYGHGYGCQASWKKENKEGGLPVFMPKSPGDIIIENDEAGPTGKWCFSVMEAVGMTLASSFSSCI